MKPFLLFFLLIGAQLVQAQSLQRVVPEQVGMSTEALMNADRVIEEAIADSILPGAVLAVVHQDKIAYLKAYGHRRILPHKEAMTTNTIFDMASCSKSMSTALCAMKLVEQGRIRLQDPVQLYFPDFKPWVHEDGTQKKSIRILHLLTHTSGLPAYAPVAQVEQQEGVSNQQKLLDYICNCPRTFEPNENFRYSCLNFVMLQHIIEKVSQQSLSDFAQQHLFSKLGMKHTGYCPTSNLELIAPTEKQADGHILCGEVHDPLARILQKGVSGNAGLFSTAEDIAILCAALQNEGEWNGQRILSPLTVKAMRSVPFETEKWGRTLGWDCRTPYASNKGDLLGPNTYGHTGYTGTSIVIDPDNDLSIILLTNAVHPHDKSSVVRLRSQVANAVAASLYPPKRIYTEHYYKRFLQFMDEPSIQSSDIIMLGNSLTEGGKAWNERLNNPHVRNRGIIGDDTEGINDRLHQILPGHPAKLFLLIGINDLSRDLTPDSIVYAIRSIVGRIQQESPQTQIYLQSLLPINESFKRYKRLTGKGCLIAYINQELKALAKEKKIKFIDLYPLFTEKGKNLLRPEVTTDGLHLNEKGYSIWVEKLKKYL